MKSNKDILLGFEVGTGQPVNIPTRNMVVAGQTQESGKTTTLEALISRASLTAISFVTKRGEGSFGKARRILPYLRERGDDWEYVLAVLESTMKQKLFKHRSLVIEVCQTAKSLADVQAAVREKLKQPKMNGFVRSLYVELNAFLEKVVPSIGRIKFASSLDLRPGVNVIDMSDRNRFPSEMQALVISSTMEWVYEHAEGVVTIVPEAWEFIPQGRGSPVKRSAQELVRKGSVLRNYVWTDSQDIGGIEKEFLRSVPVWLLGVQRESNEIERVLSNIPETVAKPSKRDVATLQRGQFFACWGAHAIKAYVQPAWMDEADARSIAMGKLSLDGIAPPPATRKPEPAREEPPALQTQDEDDMSKEDVDGIRSDLKELAAAVGSLVKTISKSPSHAAAAHAPAAHGGTVDEELLYQRIKSRLMEEAPAVFKVIQHKPELQIAIERPVVNLGGARLDAKIGRLIAEGFFNTPRQNEDIHKELKRRGVSYDNRTFGRAMADLAAGGCLTVEEDGYKKAPDLKIVKEEK